MPLSPAGGPTLGCPQPLEVLDLAQLVAVRAEGGALVLKLRGQEVTMKVRGDNGGLGVPGGGQWGYPGGGIGGTEGTGF